MRQRHGLYLSKAMSERLSLVAEAHRVSKSEILEQALQHFLTQDGPKTDGLAALERHQLIKRIGRLERDLGIAMELHAQFIRFFLTVTPPPPSDERDGAHALANVRFDRFITAVAARLRTNTRIGRQVMAQLKELGGAEHMTAGRPVEDGIDVNADDAAETSAPDEPGDG